MFDSFKAVWSLTTSCKWKTSDQRNAAVWIGVKWAAAQRERLLCRAASLRDSGSTGHSASRESAAFTAQPKVRLYRWTDSRWNFPSWLLRYILLVLQAVWYFMFKCAYHCFRINRVVTLHRNHAQYVSQWWDHGLVRPVLQEKKNA